MGWVSKPALVEKLLMVALDSPDWMLYDYDPVVHMVQSNARRSGIRHAGRNEGGLSDSNFQSYGCSPSNVIFPPFVIYTIFLGCSMPELPEEKRNRDCGL